MSDTLPPLVIPIVGDATGFNATLKQVQTATAQFGSTITSSFKSVTGGVTELGNKFRGLVAPIVAAGAAYATFGAAMESLNRADELGKMATSLGVTVEQLQELQAVARQTGGSADGMNAALRELGKNLSDAVAGEEKALLSFAKIGLKAEELKGMNLHDAFIAVSDSMSRMENAGDRLNVSQEIFGRGAKDLSETLTVGAEGFKSIAEEAKAYNRILSETDVKTLKEMGDKIDTMKLTMETLVSKVMVEFEVTVSFIADEIGRASKNAGMLQSVGFLIANAFNVVLAVILDAGKALMVTGIAISGVIAELAREAIVLSQDIYKAMTWVGKVVWEVMKSAGAAFDWLWQTGKIAFLKLKELGVGLFSDLMKSVGPHIREIGELMSEFGIAGGESLVKLGMNLEDFGASLGTDISAGINEAKDAMVKDVDTMNSTLARIGDVQSAEVPGWMKAAEEWTSDLAQKSAEMFYGMESSIIALGESWFRVEDTTDGVHSQHKKITESIEDQVSATLVLKKEYDEFLKKLDEATMKSRTEVKAKVSPTAAADDEYAMRLSALDKFHAASLMKEEQYTAAKNKIEFLHNAARLELSTKTYDAIYDASTAFHENTMQEEMDSAAKLLEMEQKAYEDKMKWVEETDMAAADRMTLLQQLHEQHSNAQLAITERQMALENQARENAAQVAANILGQAAALMDKNNKAQFYAWKAFATGQAIINAFLAYGQVLATPMPDFFGAYRTAMANITLGLGLASAAKIAATPYGGGGGAGGIGGGGGGGSSNSTYARDQGGSSTNMNVTLYGDNFSGSQVRGLIGAINDAAGDNANLRVQVAS